MLSSSLRGRKAAVAIQFLRTLFKNWTPRTSRGDSRIFLVLFIYSLPTFAQEHPFTGERYLESLDAKKITQILKTGAWSTTGQTITSK
jgi:hypothetical protein